MKTYVVKVRQVLYDIVLIDAENEDVAQEKAEQYNEEVGFDPQEIEEMDFIVLREADERDFNECDKVEVEE